MKKQNVEVDSLLIADAGYSPYANILFTTEQYLKDHPDIVKAYVEATVKGFKYYENHYSDINKLIQKENPDLPLENLDYAAGTMMPLVFGGDAASHGPGYMSKERWEELAKQMVGIGMLKTMPDVTGAFTTEFLPK